MLFAASNAALAYLVKRFMNGAFVNEGPGRPLAGARRRGACCSRCAAIGDYVQSIFRAWVGRQVIKGLRHDVFAHYLRLPTAYLDQQQSGHLLSKLTNNIELVAAAATGAAISLVSDSLTIVILLVTLFYLNWRLAAILHRCGAGHRVADENRQPQLPPLQRTHSKLDGRHHPRRERSHRCACA